MNGRKLFKEWGAVVCIYDSSYTGGRDREYHSSRPFGAKRHWDLISINAPGMVLYACGSSYVWI
jgi:hypothetical protein